jgi:beta-lactamase class A
LTAATTPPLDVKRLAKEIPELAARARPGVLGFGLMNLDSGEHWTLNGDRRFPMQSVFKAPLGAAVLAEVDARRLDLAETITISAVTAWLQSKRIGEIRIDRYERELAAAAFGTAPFRPEWKGPTFGVAIQAVPPDRRLAAMRAYLADPRDTATPRGMLDFLSRLDAGELLSPAATQRLIRMMIATTRGNDRIKAGLPQGWVYAHRPGTSGQELGLSLAFNDVGIVTVPGERRRSYAVATFLSGATLDQRSQAALFADLGQLIAKSVG